MFFFEQFSVIVTSGLTLEHNYW